MTDAAAVNILSLSAGAQNQLLRQYFSPEGTLKWTPETITNHLTEKNTDYLLSKGEMSVQQEHKLRKYAGIRHNLDSRNVVTLYEISIKKKKKNLMNH